MKPAYFLLLLFFVVPIVELYLLIRIGSVIGPLATVGLVILTAVIGVFMLRRQGFATLQRARAVLDSGQLPAREILEGVVLLIGGALLLVPGFCTDAVGFLCLLPQTRHWFLARLTKNIQVVRPESEPSATPRSRIIEGEWKREDDNHRQ